MRRTTTDRVPPSTADRYRAASRHLARAVEELKRAYAELTPEDGALPFHERVGEAIDDMHNAAERLREYATNGW